MVWPSTALNRISKTAPLDLIVFYSRNQNALALIGQDQGKDKERYVFILPSIKEPATPYAHAVRFRTDVLVYPEYQIIIDQDFDYLDLRNDKFHQLPGALMRCDHDIFLCAKLDSYGVAYLNISNGDVHFHLPRNSSCIYGKWGIYIPSFDQHSGPHLLTQYCVPSKAY